MPSCFLNKINDFDIKPLMYFGTSYKRAAAVTMSMALLACFFIVGHVFVMCTCKSTAPYTAGLLLSLIFMSALFGGCYWFDITSTQGVIVSLVNKSGVPWTAHYETPDGKRQWGYDLSDWGPYYEACQEFANNTNKFATCAGPLFVEKSEKWVSLVYFFVYVGLCATSLIFFCNKRPAVTLRIFLSVSFVLSVWGLPVYASTLKTRMPSRMGIDHCVDASHFKMLLIFSWLTAFAALALWLLVLTRSTVVIGISAAVYIAFDCAVVAYWYMLQKQQGGCEYPFHVSEFRTLLNLGTPQFVVMALLALMLLGLIGTFCCEISRTWILILIHPDGTTEVIRY